MNKFGGSKSIDLLRAFTIALIGGLLSLGALPAQAGEYVPPDEAFEGPGGWAVIDPSTGIVYGVIVGDWDRETWDQVKNSGSVDGYMGCPAPCELRYQTRATEDGNVAGWHGTSTTIDKDGNASQTNDGSVRYDSATGNFTIRNRSGDGTVTEQTLVPEKTSRDADGKGRSMNLSSGIIDVTVKKEFSSEDQVASVQTYRSNLVDPNLEVTIGIPGLSPDGFLRYLFGPNTTAADLEVIDSDITSTLLSKGYGKTESSIDEETGEELISEVLNEADAFVAAIVSLAKDIISFIGNLLGFGERP